jgi:hypothetical protein
MSEYMYDSCNVKELACTRAYENEAVFLSKARHA